MSFTRDRKNKAVDLLVFAAFIALPYYIFGGKLFIGGDDTRLYYIFPLDYIHNIATSSWFQFSSAGSYNPNYFLLPTLLIAALLRALVPSITAVDYLFFSAPLILGYAFFKKLLVELVPEARQEAVISVGALLYTLSPITIVGQLSDALYSVWLIPLFPLVAFYLIRFVKTGDFKLVAKASLWAMALSLGLYSIPWLLGLLLPTLMIAATGVALGVIKPTWLQLKRSLIFIGFIIASQSFWIVPFFVSGLIASPNSYAGLVLSGTTANTFAATVAATSTGNPYLPLIDFFHKQIAQDFRWQLYGVYKNYYDYLDFLSLSFAFVILYGILRIKKVFPGSKRGLVLFLYPLLLLCLFFFTVNIGLFKSVFIELGRIPGFVMFRNAYNKFALAYIFVYSASFTASLFFIKRQLNSKGKILLPFFVLLIILNALPIKTLINKPIWTTQNTYSTISYPKDYVSFLKAVGKRVPATDSIFDFPFNDSSYGIVKDQNSENVFSGRSPVKILSGRNDYSGSLSFDAQTAYLLNNYIIDRNYEKIRQLFNLYGIKYVLVTSNIPKPILNSYLFTPSVLSKEDATFKQAMLGSLVLSSSDGAYKLYRAKDVNNQFSPTSSATPAYSYIGTNQNFTPTNSSLDSLDQTLALDGTGLPLISAQVKGFSLPAYSVSEGDQFKLDPGEYSLILDNPETASMVFNQNNQLLQIKRPISLEVNGQQITSNQQSTIANLTSGEGLTVNDLPLGADQLNGYTISSKDKIKHLLPVNENLFSGQNYLQSAVKEDCNNYQGGNHVHFLVLSGSTFQLIGNNEHQACAWKSIPVSPKMLYRVQFDYQTDSNNLRFVVLNPDGERLVDQELERSDNTFRHFSTFISASPTTSSIRIYMYSGATGGISTTTYKNTVLSSFTVGSALNIKDPIDGLALKLPISIPIGSTFSQHLDEHIENASDLTFSNWSKSDCNALNSLPFTSFSYTSDGSNVLLSAKGNHNACIYNTFDINSNDEYLLSLNFGKSKNIKADVFLDFGQNYNHVIIPLDGSGGLRKVISPPTGAKSMTVYLYSGSSPESSKVRYTGIKIWSLPKYEYGNVLVQTPPSGRFNYSTSTTKVNQDKYQIRVSNVTKQFLLNLDEPFHPGWILLASNGSILKDSRHIEANNFSNAWVIDPAQMCEGFPKSCTRNADGSYNLNLVAEFAPQRWFYLGSIISGLTLLGCIGYLIWVPLSRRRKREGE